MSPARSPRTPQPTEHGAIELPDGRQIGFAEYGDPTANPILYFHGFPGGRHWVPDGGLAPGTRYRFIALERPGFGLSSRCANRGLLDWPIDVEHVADALGLDRFALAAWSAGGLYALACAAALEDRLSAVGLISSSGPIYDHPEFDPLLLPDMQLALPMVRADPSGAWDLALDYAGRQAHAWQADPALYLSEWLAPNTLSDRSLYYLQRNRWQANLETTFGSGPEAPADDLVIWLGSCPIAFDQIRVPLRAWHGTEDPIPIEAIDYVVSQVPGALLVPYRGEAHFLSPTHHDEWMEFFLSS